MKPSTTQTGTASSSWRPTHQRAILYGALLVVALLVVTMGVYALYEHDHKKTTPPSVTAAEGVDKDIAKKVAAGLPVNATNAQKNTYYEEALYVLITTGDNKKTADYYINEVLPSKADIPRDVEENIIGVLLATNHRAEAKVLVKKMIVSYSQPAAGGAVVERYYANKLDRYKTMEANL